MSKTSALIDDLNEVMRKHDAVMTVSWQDPWTHYITGPQPGSFVIGLRGPGINHDRFVPDDFDAQQAFPWHGHMDGITIPCA